ncbi:MAG TPA: aminotransferase class I/II-fold pyridoxal phosphate-dependent enzyme [Streptosporangiaceae bacterium]|nr:aminotransferase class I/II-fold pyridoxal phosphate-dependent enzyme [Streptosporangiaceae bacterium]
MSLRPETRTVHPPIPRPSGSTPLSVPLYQGHVFAFDGADELANAFDGPDSAYFYSRLGNPTVRAFEEAVADLEGGTAALAFASGMGAISAVILGHVGAGDHVIAQTCLYGGTYSLLRDLAERWGVEVTFISGDDPAEVRDALRPATKLLYLETIANPTTQVVDLPALIEAAGPDRTGLIRVVDNTFATPLLCRPIEHGADVVVHSATKFLGGHSDLLGGVAVFASADVRRRIWDHAIDLGACADPFAAWLALRGMQTLALRVERQCATALFLAERLAEHPAVARVAYPGLPGHPDHATARRLLPAGGAVLSFDLAGGREAGRTFVEATRLLALTGSLGSVHSLVLHPASTTHRQLDAASLAAASIGEGTIRLAVGVEHRDDLWHDIEQALAKLG